MAATFRTTDRYHDEAASTYAHLAATGALPPAEQARHLRIAHRTQAATPAALDPVEIAEAHVLAHVDAPGLIRGTR